MSVDDSTVAEENGLKPLGSSPPLHVRALWDVARLWSVSRPRSEKGRPDLPLLSVFLGRGVIPYGKGRGQVHKPSVDLSGYQVVHPGDLVLNNQQAWRGSVGVSRHLGIVSPAYVVLALADRLHPRFADYLFQCRTMVSQFVTASKGVGDIQRDIHTPWLMNVRVPLPPLPEQVGLVRYLDYVDRRLRLYIRGKQRLITLLEEQKQAVIQRAVTRGLDPSIRLKPTGVDWLGNVPEHWEVKRCRYVFREVDRRSSDGSEQHLSMSQRLGLVPSNLVEHRTLQSESYAGGKLCEVGDLVMNRLKAHLGVFSLARCAGVVSPDYTVLRPVEVAGVEYFERVLRSPTCRRELRVRAKGIVEGFWRLYTDDFYDIRLPVPPAHEREALGRFFAAETRTVEEALHRAEREVALLGEYRNRFVADVVTGSLDVREAAARLPTEVEAPETLDAFESAEEADDADADETYEVADEAEA